MHLKSLVLKGFKSFADRSVLAFEPGITAIVGPNGSGKSNVSDAVLWVLGERNAKNLRGQAMEDVVFAGSSARKSAGLAEVDLVLDNTDGTLPVDYTEVALTRRMYRNGESEYLINGSPARRMDFLDILHDSGLGTGTHSIISQGSIDSILASKPEDRRAIVEQAAGVLKHKQRKLKSERKLAQMDVHLARVRDVAAEVERQLKPLERKAKRALAYRDLAEEMAEVTLVLAVDDLRVLQAKHGEVSERESQLGEELTRRREEAFVLDSHIEEIQERIRNSAAGTREHSDRYRRSQAVAERFDSLTLLLREKQRSAADFETEMATTRLQIAERLTAAEEGLAAALVQCESTQAEYDAAEARVTTLLNEQGGLVAERTRLEKSLREQNNEEHTIARDIEITREAQIKNNELLASSTAHEKLIAGRGAELASQLDAAKADFDRARIDVQSNEVALATLKDREAQSATALAEALSAREAAVARYDAARDEAAVLASEIRGLEEVERASEAAGPALAWLMENREHFSSALTPITHAITAPDGLEPLVERLLGADLTALMTADLASANAVAESLLQQNASGEVVLLPMASMCAPVSAAVASTPATTSAPTPINAPANASYLLSMLSYPDEAASVVSGLLGDVFVCESREAALAAHAQDKHGYRFATRDGFCVWPNGKMSVGHSAADAGEGALARHRRLVQMREACQRAEAERNSALDARETAEETLRTKQTLALQISRELAELKGAADSVRSSLDRAKTAYEALQREYDELGKRREQVMADLASARPAAEELAARLVALEASHEQARSTIRDTHAQLNPLKSRIDALASELSEARLSSATLSERLSYAQRMADTRRADIASLHEEEHVAEQTRVRKARIAQATAPLIARFSSLAAHAHGTTGHLEDIMLAAQGASSSLHETMSEARRKSRVAQEACEEVNARIAELRVEAGRLEVQVAAAVDAIVADCGVPLEQALSVPAPENRPELEDRAFKLRRRISNMGSIDPDAADEYERLKRRFDYMSTQIADLRSARRALERITAVIDERMKVDFLNTFEQVNANFQEVFGELFPGGTAELLLVGSEEEQDAGIEVRAQPRGKRITKMTLMSGGEKSLTALALLFAVYKTRATPFYILDEVEAALDDSNLRRLCTYLDTLRESTQLILITHQRRTMELADVLYGISMQADGVTRVVSQRLSRALHYAEE